MDANHYTTAQAVSLRLAGLRAEKSGPTAGRKKAEVGFWWKPTSG
jgi:hypothetical protein